MNHPGGPQIGYQPPQKMPPFQPRMPLNHPQMHNMPGSMIQPQPNVRRPMQQPNPQAIHNVFQDSSDASNIHQQPNIHIQPGNL
jgi:hypothetical protein